MVKLILRKHDANSIFFLFTPRNVRRETNGIQNVVLMKLTLEERLGN